MITMSGEDVGNHRFVRRRTTIEWLHTKKLVTDNELLTAEILSLLLEWRLTSVGPLDSTILFSEKYMRKAPLLQIIPAQFHLKGMFLGSKPGGEDGVPLEADIEKLGRS